MLSCAVASLFLSRAQSTCMECAQTVRCWGMFKEDLRRRLMMPGEWTDKALPYGLPSEGRDRAGYCNRCEVAQEPSQCHIYASGCTQPCLKHKNLTHRHPHSGTHLADVPNAAIYQHQAHMTGSCTRFKCLSLRACTSCWTTNQWSACLCAAAIALDHLSCCATATFYFDRLPTSSRCLANTSPALRIAAAAAAAIYGVYRRRSRNHTV
jgi:hypothetical protein